MALNMKYINKYLRNLKPYKLASHKIWNVEPKKRNDILKLDWNESTCPPSPKVKEALNNLLSQDNFFNLYPSTYNEKLLSKLSDYVGMPVDNIQYFASSDSLHEYIAKLYISIGDPVLILWPSYDNFRLTAEVNGAKLYFSELTDKFEFDFNKFSSDIERINPSLVYICNPNNPTGTLVTPDQIKNLLTAFPDTMFLIDEAYSEFSKVSVNSYVTEYDNLLVTHTMSKAFALANFRFGYLVSSKENIKDISRIRNPKNITTFTQNAVIAALSDVDYMWKYVEEVNSAKKWFTEEINSLDSRVKVYHSNGNFVLIKCADVQIKDKIVERLAENNIFVRDVNQSETLKNCFRVTIGNRKDMEKVFDNLKKILLG
ncbi:MAG: histidinol-phosphate aminotransferase family protein [Clostridia bacterium]|nr:histidinol-phosphate aminotransferase family protein [Clostridia bacterium]